MTVLYLHYAIYVDSFTQLKLTSNPQYNFTMANDGDKHKLGYRNGYY